MQAQNLKGATGCLGSVLLVAGTTTTVTTTGTPGYAIRGKAFAAAALTNSATPTTDATTGLAFLGVKRGFGSVFVYGLNAAGGLVCAQGSIIALDTSGATYAWGSSPQFPTLPDTMCPIAYLTILAGATADVATGWIQGTANQAGVTGITYARTNVALGMPDRPQSA